MKSLILGFLLLCVSVPAFSEEAPLTPEIIPAVAKLRIFCQACHAVGGLRFIWSDDDAQVWTYLFNNRAPNSPKLWADDIIDVLSWPTAIPPPFDQPMDPINHRDWMPKGSKRLELANDLTDGQATRQMLLEALRHRP